MDNNIEVVIKIPKYIYDETLENGFLQPIHGGVVAKCFEQGTLLPKGHGNLIDKESLIKAIEQKAKRLENLDTINGLCGAVALAYEAETVIEADKEHNENEKV